MNISLKRKLGHLHSFTDFTNILREVERENESRRDRRGAREWWLGEKVKLGFEFLKIRGKGDSLYSSIKS